VGRPGGQGGLQPRTSKLSQVQELAEKVGEVRGPVTFEATLGHFVTTRDGNILVSILTPGREASEVARLVALFGYRLKVTMEVERVSWDAV
jgi:hypothetical protein